MNRDRRNHRHQNSSWKNAGINQEQYPSKNENRPHNDSKKKDFHAGSRNTVSFEQIKADEEAISAFKNANQCTCPVCGKLIPDLSSALSDKTTGKPVHFDCALAEAGKNEKLEAGDKIAYIGQGRFGIINYPNVHDVKHFTIKKIIDWEDKEKRSPWRNEMSDLYSQVK